MKTFFNYQTKLACCALLIASYFIFFVPALSVQEQAIIDEFMNFRMSVSVCEPDAAIENIEQYRTALFDSEQATMFSDEFQLILNNLFVLERYNYLYEKDIVHPELEGLITAQNDKNEAWFKTVKGKETDKWLYCTAGDVISCCMQFMPVTKAMNRGLVIKKYYDAALTQDPDFAYGMMNMAQWYFHAPAIGGGSKKKALAYFEKAVTSARNPAERFYAKILCSQALIDGDEKNRSAAMLSDAIAICPESRYAARIKKLNDAGYSLFYYMLNRAKIDAKLK